MVCPLKGIEDVLADVLKRRMAPAVGRRGEKGVGREEEGGGEGGRGNKDGV